MDQWHTGKGNQGIDDMHACMSCFEVFIFGKKKNKIPTLEYQYQNRNQIWIVAIGPAAKFWVGELTS